MRTSHKRVSGSAIIALFIGALLIGSFGITNAAPNPGQARQTGSRELTAGHGTSTAHRTPLRLSSTPPQLTDTQRQRLDAAIARANRPGLPLRAEPADAAFAAVPSTPETAAARTAPEANTNGLLAPNDFAFFRAANVHASADIPASSRSQVGEPSADVRGDAVFMTGNWYAAFSTDRGQIFQYIDPSTSFPADDGGFCCDQVVIYDASRDLMFWLLQYINDGATNRQRLVVMHGSELVAGMQSANFYYYDFSPAIFGLTGDRELDYPKLALSNNFLYINTNVFDISDENFTNAVAWRLPLDELATGGTVNFQFFTRDDVGSLMPTDGATSTMYWGTHTTTSEVRIYRWDETSGQIAWDDVAIAAWSNATHHCVTPDGNDPCAFGDGRMLGGWVANGIIGFMWNSSQHGGYPFPYVDVARFNQHNRTLIDQPILWHRDYAWLYPAVSVNRRGHIAGPVFVAGGTFYPQMNILIADDVSGAPPPWENYFVAASTHGPLRNRWGDYMAARRHPNYPATWTGAGFILQGGGDNASMRPHWVWFGRQRDTPPSTPGNDDIAQAQGLTPASQPAAKSAAITLVSVSQDTTQATTAVDDPISACGVASSRQSHSVWYRFTAAQKGSYTVSTAGSSYDTVVALWAGARGALANAGCNDDTLAGKAATLTRELAAGNYYIEVMQYGAGTGGHLQLTISFEPRVTANLQALYPFEEAGGIVIHDVAGAGAPQNLYLAAPQSARWVAGGLTLTTTTTLASESVATRLIATARASNEVSIELWIRPTNTRQHNLARILTLSNDAALRNIELLQERGDSRTPVRYAARLRTSTSPMGGTWLRAPAQAYSPNLQHIVFTRDATGLAKLYLNGVEQARAVMGGDFSTWDGSYHLVLGNTLAADRPWLGEYQLVAFYNRALIPAEVDQNFRAGP